jgi:antirestriction protein
MNTKISRKCANGQTSLAEHREDSGAIAAYISWAEDVGLEVTSEEFESRYCGHWESGEDFALKSNEIEELYNWSNLKKSITFGQ